MKYDQNDLSVNENVEENDLVNDLTNVSDVTQAEFLQYLDKVRSFAQSNGVSEDIQKALSDLEALGVSRKFNNSSNQTQITKFFKHK